MAGDSERVTAEDVLRLMQAGYAERDLLVMKLTKSKVREMLGAKGVVYDGASKDVKQDLQFVYSSKRCGTASVSGERGAAEAARAKDSGRTIEIKCKICEEGVLTKKRVYILSGPAVVIGYLLLVPPMASMGIAGVVFVVSTVMGIVGVAAWHPLGILGVVGSVSAVWILPGLFVSGLLGWVLTMKKNVLCCTRCGAVFNAL